MVSDRLDGLPMLGGVLQDRIARHDATLNFIEHDLPPELDQCPTLVAGDGSGVRKKNAEDSLPPAPLLPPPPPPGRLGDIPAAQRPQPPATLTRPAVPHTPSSRP